MKKQAYDIKINRGKGFLWEGSEYLDPFDNETEKDRNIERLREKYGVGLGEYLNVSNFFNVYC